MIADGELPRALQFRHTPREEAAADEKVIELSASHPIATSWGRGPVSPGVADQAGALPHLIQPHIGDYMAANG
jgi:hypothetical protein